MTEHTNETLVELIRSTSKKSDQSKYLAELYEQNYPYILKVCKRFSGHEELDDLMQEAFFGLRIAADRYDPDQGTPFINYAAIWIEQAIQRYLENCGNTIRVPSYLYRSIIKYIQTERAFIQDHGRKPTDQELIELLSLKNPAQLKRIKDRIDILNLLSLDKAIISEDASETFADTLPDPVDYYEEMTEQMDAERKKQDVWDEVDTLDNKKAEIIRKRFRDNMTLEQIGEYFGNSQEGIRQLQNNALKKLARSKKLRKYAEDYLSAKAYSGISLTAYLNTGTSATERTAIESYEHNIQNHVRGTERRLSRMKKRIAAELVNISI